MPHCALRVFKITGKHAVKCPPYKGTLQRKISRGLFNDAYARLFPEFLHKSICCGYSFELPQLDLLRQFKQVLITNEFIKK